MAPPAPCNIGNSGRWGILADDIEKEIEVGVFWSSEKIKLSKRISIKKKNENSILMNTSQYRMLL